MNYMNKSILYCGFESLFSSLFQLLVAGHPGVRVKTLVVGFPPCICAQLTSVLSFGNMLRLLIYLRSDLVRPAQGKQPVIRALERDQPNYKRILEPAVKYAFGHIVHITRL